MTVSRPAYPGLYLVCDPSPERAGALVSAMIEAAGGTPAEAVCAVEGLDWALAAVAPRAAEPNCGPGLYSDGRDVLVWTGEMFPPECWPAAAADGGRAGQIAGTVLRRLQVLGTQILGEIDGTFCGAWYDHRHHSWTVFNDRWGLIPVFWWSRGERLVVAPKAQLAWRACGEPLATDDTGVADLLRTANMQDDRTLIEGVHWLEPASALRWRPHNVRADRFWDFQHRPRPVPRYDDLLESFVEVSRQTILRQTTCRVPLRLGISGGLDSRIILALCHDIDRVPDCFTSGFAFSEDVRFGRRLARAAGAGHEPLLLNDQVIARQLEELIVETDGLHGAAHLILSGPIRDHLADEAGTVLLEGHLHGVLGGSDLPTAEDIRSPRPPHAHAWARDFLHGGGSPELMDRLLRPDLAAASRQRWCTHVDDRFWQAPVEDPLYRAEYAIIAGRSGRNDVLVPAMNRRHVLARHPACETLMIDWYASTPAPLRRGRQVYIDVLRRFFPRFARVPRADACNGFPLAQGPWLREYHWQREKLHRWWSACRYAEARRWGSSSAGLRGWALEAWKRSGGLDVLTARDARVLRWVRRDVLMELWQSAERDPRQAAPLLNLATVEVMIRALEQMPVYDDTTDGGSLRFRRVHEIIEPADCAAQGVH